jgi:uncharacterized membrane protein YeaQ/YmgE (transglycosylase-associated protein family)
MEILYAAFYGLLILAAGIFIGCGNQGGLLGALITGVIFGLIAAIPCFRENYTTGVAVTVVAAIVGCTIATLLPADSGIRRMSQNQSMLHIKVFSYELGHDSDSEK